MITGINHITLAVRDVARAFDFYTDVLGFRPVARWPRGAYLLASETWIALTLDPQTRPAPLPEYTHVAFDVAPEHFEALSQRILAAEAPLWQENRTEGDSLYFLDPDGHKLEIHTTDLAARLRAARQAPWDDLTFFDETP